VLSYYPGTATGASVALGPPVTVATGWSSFTSVVGIGDFTKDGHADILARDASGALWTYPGNGSGTLGARIASGTGFSPYTLAAAGDLNGDGFPDLFTIDSGGTLRLYTGNGAGGWLTGSVLTPTFSGDTLAGSGNTLKTGPAPGAQAGAGDFNGDGKADLVVRDSSGVVWLYPGNGGTGFGTRVQVATGWQSMTAVVSVGDFDGDGKPDLVARDASGNLLLYPGSGSAGVGAPVALATGWQSMTAIQGGTDFLGTGHVGLLARDSAGVLWYYPGTGAGASVALGARIQVATGWAAMTAIIGIGDFTSDGHSDILARDASGALWTYPGTGSGTLGARIASGTGWGPYALASAGDLNGDGFQDLITTDSTGTIRLYTGNGAGGWLAGSVLTPTIPGDTVAGG
jgi:hypothetical protein